MPDTFYTDRAVITPIMPDNCDTGGGAVLRHEVFCLQEISDEITPLFKYQHTIDGV